LQDDDDEEDEEEDPDSEPADMKIVTKGGHPSKKQRTSGSDMLSIMPVQVTQTNSFDLVLTPYLTVNRKNLLM